MVRRGSFIGGQDNLSVPDAPTIGAATTGNAQVSVAFTAPSAVGDDPITSFGVSVFPATGTTKTFRVTVASGNLYGGGTGNVFYIDGVGNPALTLVKGFTYVFDQEDSSNSGHPFHFKNSSDSQYTTGVTVTGTAGQSGSKVTLVLAEDASEPSAYYCTAHGNGMGNTITLVAPSASDDPLGQAQYSNTGSSSPIIVTGLTNDTSYVAKAWAINDYGNGPLSDATSSFTPVLPTPGIDFDGTNDYLSRSSDLVGNADGKTFTFSVWFYPDNDTTGYLYEINTGSGYSFEISNNGGGILMRGKTAGGTEILRAEENVGQKFANQTFYHLLISIDMADSSNRHIYLNDEPYGSVQWTTYTDGAINFTASNHGIGARAAGTAGQKGRLAGVYLDYTYRDLSTTSNRRLFIDADGQFVTPPTTGILSLNMNDVSSVATNSGTGGDFTLNGTVAQSGRNVLQYNAAASEFDGSADYVSKSSVTGLSGGNSGTFAFWFNNDILNQRPICGFGASGYGGAIQIDVNSSSYGIQFTAYSTGNSLIADFRVGFNPDLATNKWHHCVITFDLSDTSKRDIRINGVAQSVTYSTYTDGTINWASNVFEVAKAGGSYFDGGISDFWFDDSYIDLSSSNPFYDTSTSKPKNLSGDGSTPTGSSPIIYLPLRGDDAGNNKGTGGDFTVNSGPFTGVRGPSEFWGESAEFNGSDQYLNRTTALSGVSDGKVLTFVCAIALDSGANGTVFSINNTSGNTGFRLNLTQNFGGDTRIVLNIVESSGGSAIVEVAERVTQWSAGEWHILMLSVDMTDTSKRYLYDGHTNVNPTWSSYVNDTMELSSTRLGIASQYNGSAHDSFLDGKIGFLYFDTAYTDFSSEANRLKFYDAFGYPVDLGSNGSTPTGTQPLIYMNKGFHSGTNLGSGGNFTPQGTPTDGGYVKG
jgi:hypothetical protein